MDKNNAKNESNSKQRMQKPEIYGCLFAFLAALIILALLSI